MSRNNTNLLEETIEVLKDNNKTIEDIIWFGSRNERNTNNLKNFLDVCYDSGYGCNEIPSGLILVGDTFWLNRGEYDGSEWWNFISYPQPPIDSTDKPMSDMPVY